MSKVRGSVQLIDLPQIHDPRGDLTFVEGGNSIPFDIIVIRAYDVQFTCLPTQNTAERGTLMLVFDRKAVS